MKKIILQGLPGVGKTTLTKKIAEKLKQTNVEVNGFYTEEIRDRNNHRQGFDIVTLDGVRGVLARKSSGEPCKYKVGTYNVQLDDFERIALPVLNQLGSVIIIDEIGKMELFSKKFEISVEKVIADPNIIVLATIPLKSGPPLVQRIRNDKNNHLITVTTTNRDQLQDEIIKIIT